MKIKSSILLLPLQLNWDKGMSGYINSPFPFHADFENLHHGEAAEFSFVVNCGWITNMKMK